LIVKADDVGLHMANEGRLGLTRSVGRGIVRGMPGFMSVLTWVGTAAMLWVGGSIIIHGLAEMGWHAPEEMIHHAAEAVAHLLPNGASGFVSWLVKAVIDGVLGLALGLALIPLVATVIGPALRAVGVGAKAGDH